MLNLSLRMYYQGSISSRFYRHSEANIVITKYRSNQLILLLRSTHFFLHVFDIHKYLLTMKFFSTNYGGNVSSVLHA